MANSDFVTALGAVADARAVLTVATQALEATERQADISSTLRIGLALLQSAYSALDALKGPI